MSVRAIVEKGKIIETVSQNSLSNTKKSTSGMDKDAFLQLLVAQMKYQDPLEPTSNTEFVSQYAQFSQVEQIQNMATTMELQRASSLVGRTVYIETRGKDGNTLEIAGKVDFVTYEGNRAFLVINESLYPLEDVLHVMDDDYMDAYKLATELVNGISKLPHVNTIDLSYGDTIDRLEEIYGKMTDYQKSFVAKEKADALQDYITRLRAVRGIHTGQTFMNDMDKLLPDVDDLTLDDESNVNKLRETYENMSEYQKGFVDPDYVTLLEAYVSKLNELKNP